MTAVDDEYAGLAGDGTSAFEGLSDAAMAGDPAVLLDELHATFRRFVVFPSPEAADAVTLWTAATHAQPAWEIAARLQIKSPVKRCGKTRLQEIIAGTAHKVLRTVNISPAALVRSIDQADPPTLILDEADSVFAKRRGERSEGAEDLRGILNSGYSRDWPYIRWDAAARRTEACPTYAMAALGGIGSLPDTIEDRAVTIAMRRRAPGETVAAYRSRQVKPGLHDLRDRLHTWLAGEVEQLAAAEPRLPVDDREYEVWAPLAAVADAAGGGWPDRARAACLALTGADDPDETTLGERLLADLLTIYATGYGDDGAPSGYADAHPTSMLLARLCGMDEAPWGEWTGRGRREAGLTARDLSRLLRPYKVRSRNVRVGGGQAKGYYAADLADPWARYTFRHVVRPVRPAVPDTLRHAQPERGRIPHTDPSHDPSQRESSVTDTLWDGGTAGTADVPKRVTSDTVSPAEGALPPAECDGVTDVTDSYAGRPAATLAAAPADDDLPADPDWLDGAVAYLTAGRPQ